MRVLCPSVSRAAAIEILRKGWGDLARFRHNKYRAKLAFASDFGSWSRTDAVRPSDVVWLVEVQGRVPTLSLSSGIRRWGTFAYDERLGGSAGENAGPGLSDPRWNSYPDYSESCDASRKGV